MGHEIYRRGGRVGRTRQEAGRRGLSRAGWRSAKATSRAPVAGQPANQGSRVSQKSQSALRSPLSVVVAGSSRMLRSLARS